MIIATLADISEGGDEVPRNAFKFLQRQMKVALPLRRPLACMKSAFRTG